MQSKNIKKVQNLFEQLSKIKEQNIIIVNFTTSKFGLINPKNFQTQSFCLKDIKSQINLIIFISSQRHATPYFQYSSFQKGRILVTNNIRTVYQLVDQSQEDNSKYYVYVSSIRNTYQNGLDEFHFLENVAVLLKKYPGKVILQMNPIYRQNFNSNFKNLINYFQNSQRKNILKLRTKSADYHFLCDSQSGKNLDVNEFPYLNVIQLQNINQKEQEKYKNVFQDKNIQILRKERVLYATDNVLKCLQKRKKQLKLNQNQNFSKQQLKNIKANKRKIEQYYELNKDFKHPELQKILKIYQECGIILCQFRNLEILRAQIQEEKIDGFVPDYEDEEITCYYTDMTKILGNFITQNLQKFPIIITDSPLNFLEGRNVSFKYVQIEDDFYHTLTKHSKNPKLQFQKIVHRQNNQESKDAFLYSFIKESNFQLLKQFKQVENSYEYPINLEKRFSKYKKPIQKEKQQKYKANQIKQGIFFLQQKEKEKLKKIKIKNMDETRNQVSQAEDSSRTIDYTSQQKSIIHFSSQSQEIMMIKKSSQSFLSISTNSSQYNQSSADSYFKNFNQDPLVCNFQKKEKYEQSEINMKKQLSYAQKIHYYMKSQLYQDKFTQNANQYYKEILQLKLKQNPILQKKIQNELFNLLRVDWVFNLKIGNKIQNQPRKNMLQMLKMLDHQLKTEYAVKMETISEVSLTLILERFRIRVEKKQQNTFQVIFKSIIINNSLYNTDFKGFCHYLEKDQFVQIYEKLMHLNVIEQMQAAQKKNYDFFMKCIKGQDNSQDSVMQEKKDKNLQK